MQSPYADNDGDEPDDPGIIVLLKRRKKVQLKMWLHIL